MFLEISVPTGISVITPYPDLSISVHFYLITVNFFRVSYPDWLDITREPSVDIGRPPGRTLQAPATDQRKRTTAALVCRHVQERLGGGHTNTARGTWKERKAQCLQNLWHGDCIITIVMLIVDNF